MPLGNIHSSFHCLTAGTGCPPKALLQSSQKAAPERSRRQPPTGQQKSNGMIKLPTYHHPYRGTVPFHQSVHPSLRGGASRRGKPLSGIAHFVPAPTPVSSSVFSQQRAEKMYRERLWSLHFHQSLLDTRSSRRALEVTYAGFRTRKFRQFEWFFTATRRKNVSGTLVVNAFSPITSRYTLLTSRTRSDEGRTDR